jgi:uncharacterized protein (DUF849 family)
VSSIESWGEEAMRQFYFKAMIEKSAGEHADWKAVDAAILQAAAMAKEVAPYWHVRFGVENLFSAGQAALTHGAAAARPRRQILTGMSNFRYPRCD